MMDTKIEFHSELVFEYNDVDCFVILLEQLTTILR